MTGMTYAGYADAQSGRHLALAVMVGDVPLSGVEDLFASAADLGALFGARQQSY